MRSSGITVSAINESVIKGSIPLGTPILCARLIIFRVFLATEEWLQRVAQPIGIDRDGNFFDLDLLPGSFDLDDNIPEIIKQQLIAMDEALQQLIIR